MWPVRVHVVSKLCHNEEWFNLSQQISRLNKKYILTQVCCIEYDQKKQVLCNYAISKNGTYIDSWQGQCGKFISCTLQILFSISSCKEFMGNSKIDFFHISGTITSYCKSLLADDMGAKHSCYNHVEQSSGKKSGKYKSYHRLLYLISGVSNFQLFGTKPVSLGVDFMLTCCCLR